MRKFYDIQQDDEWLQLRTGYITTSNFATIMANYGKVFGNPAVQYAMKVAIESKTKRNIETFKNDYMLRGTELEESARQAYSDFTFTDVDNGGFMTFGRFASSSDGIIDPGLIEIKCPKYSTHMERFIKGGADNSYIWQMSGQMWIYDKDFVDFVSYCPDFPEDKQLYIFRVERDQKEEDKMISRLNEFVELVDKYINLL